MFFKAEPHFGVKVILCLMQPQNRQDEPNHLITIEHIALNYNELFSFYLRVCLHFISRVSLLKGAVWLKALFFIDFHPFS